jgi:hypothetical protein
MKNDELQHNVMLSIALFIVMLGAIGLYHPRDDITNLKYKLLCFLTSNKIIFLEKGASFELE